MIVHDPVFRIGILAVHPFGFFVAIGLVLGYVVAMWRALAAGARARYLPGMFVVVVLGAFIVARLTFVALHPAAVRGGAQTVLALWQGGLSLAGGLVGGALLLAVYTWARREPFCRWADVVAPAAALGIAVGMLGLPSSGEGWGEPTKGPFYMSVDPALRPDALISATRFHPIFAYEALLFGVLAVVLLLLGWRQSRTGRPVAGSLGLFFLLVAMLGYGALRPLTLDAPNGTLVMQTQVLCAVAAAVAFALLALRLWRSRGDAEITREIEQVRLASGQ
jgi:phosphatidylglycerol:prolipoprotein diacylglycerol transferase